jgi:hypothetical protein
VNSIVSELHCWIFPGLRECALVQRISSYPLLREIVPEVLDFLNLQVGGLASQQRGLRPPTGTPNCGKRYSVLCAQDEARRNLKEALIERGAEDLVRFLRELKRLMRAVLSRKAGARLYDYWVSSRISLFLYGHPAEPSNGKGQ